MKTNREINNGWDFVIQVGPTPEESPPAPDTLQTPEANAALLDAYNWAVEKAPTSSRAANAKVYIEAIKNNRQYEPTEPDRADSTQLMYIVGNLNYWRGETARESKKVLNDYISTINNQQIMKTNQEIIETIKEANNMTTKTPARICTPCFQRIEKDFLEDETFYMDAIKLFAATKGDQITSHHCDGSNTESAANCKCTCNLGTNKTEGAEKMTTTKKPRRICDSCHDAITEEFIGEEEDINEDLILFAATMGADIPDHDCDKSEDPTVNCRCACSLYRT